jgi:hypothetical protein
MRGGAVAVHFQGNHWLYPCDSLDLTTAHGLNSRSRGCKPCAMEYAVRNRGKPCSFFPLPEVVESKWLRPTSC